MHIYVCILIVTLTKANLATPTTPYTIVILAVNTQYGGQS
jgi:hypothetical protein